MSNFKLDLFGLFIVYIKEIIKKILLKWKSRIEEHILKVEV